MVEQICPRLANKRRKLTLRAVIARHRGTWSCGKSRLKQEHGDKGNPSMSLWFSFFVQEKNQDAAVLVQFSATKASYFTRRRMQPASAIKPPPSRTMEAGSGTLTPLVFTTDQPSAPSLLPVTVPDMPIVAMSLKWVLNSSPLIVNKYPAVPWPLCSAGGNAQRAQPA